MRTPEPLPRPNRNELQLRNQPTGGQDKQDAPAVRGRRDDGAADEPPDAGGDRREGRVHGGRFLGEVRGRAARGQAGPVCQADGQLRQLPEAAAGLREEATAVHQVRILVQFSIGKNIHERETLIFIIAQSTVRYCTINSYRGKIAKII